MAKAVVTDSAAASVDRLVDPATKPHRRQLLTLMGFSFAFAALAVATDANQRLNGDDLQPVVPRLLAALALTLAGLAGVLAVRNRKARDTGRRSTGWTLTGLGLGVIFLGQAASYAATAWSAPVFDVRTEVIPLLLGTPIFAVGMLLLAWPPSMNTLDRWSVVADTSVSAVALFAIWLLTIAPSFEAADDPVQQTFITIDPWVQFLATTLLVALASASRRSGSLPLTQLVLLQTAIALYLLADILGDVIPGADRDSTVTWSIVGYVGAMALFLLFAVRPALETETPNTQVRRERWATVVPAIPLILLALVIGLYRLTSGPLDAVAASVVFVSIVAVIIVDVVRRAILYHQLRQHLTVAAAEKLSEGANQEWFAALLGDSLDVVTVVDRHGRIVYQTPSVQRAFGYRPSELVGVGIHRMSANLDQDAIARLLLRAAIDEAGVGPHDVVVIDAAAALHDTETTIRPMTVDGADAFVFTTRDVTDRRQLRAELSASGMRDPLTGLNNRDGFLNRLEVLHSDHTQSVGVALIDLSGFRDLNDGHGHEVGDEALRAVAMGLNRLPDFVGAVGRIGGDEFAFAVCSSDVEADMGRAQRQLQADLTGVDLSDGSIADLDFSVGYAGCMGTPHFTAVELMQQADLALSVARNSLSSGIARFEPHMRTALTNRLKAEADLRDALINDRILVFYQPVVSLDDGSITGVEALVRMKNAEGELISPALFVSLAEELGLIHQLGSIVLRTALADLDHMKRALQRSIRVAVNVSALQLDDSLQPMVSDALAATATDPSELVLELTETVMAENQVAASVHLAGLRALGAAVALDDFGTGFSSLSYLSTMPVDILKIDRSFVAGLESSNASLQLVRSVVQLAAGLGLATVAEGVENAQQEGLLRDLGAERAQGFHYARPMPLPKLLDLMRATGGKLPAP